MTGPQPYAVGDPVKVTAVPLSDQFRASGTLPGGMRLLGPDGRPVSSADFKTPIDYGPGTPLVPRITEIDYPPREYDYPLGYNIQIQPRSEDGLPDFPTLRFLADFCDYIRIAIEHRKDELRGLDWGFVPRQDGLPRAQREALQKDIETAHAFWEVPNRVDKMPWHQWIAQVIEEIFVTDATSIHIVRDRVGRLHSLRQVDGATMKPIIDGFGTVIGFQQIIRGYPTTQYTTDELLYPVYNPVVNSIYGTSHTEDILPTVATLIRKQLWELTYLTEGSVPDAFINAPDGSSPDDIQAVQAIFDKLVGGNDRERHRLRVIPYGATVQSSKPFSFSREWEQVLLTKVAARFAINKSLFIAETSHTSSKTTGSTTRDAGLKPLQKFITWFMNDVTWRLLGLPNIKQKWVEEVDAVETERAKVIVERVNAGIITINEAREEDDMDPMVPAEGTGPLPKYVNRDTLAAGIFTQAELRSAFNLNPKPKPGSVMATATGFQPMSPEQIEEEAAEPTPQPPALAVQPPGGVPGKGPGPDASSSLPPGAGPPAKPPLDPAVKAELGEFRRYALKRIGKSLSGFETKAIPPEVRASIVAELEKVVAGGPPSVYAVFAKAEVALTERVQEPKRAAHVKKIRDIYKAAFDAEHARVLAMSATMLPKEKAVA